MILIHVTTSSRREATRIGKTLLMEKLAGSVSIIDSVTTMYFWDGELQREKEAVLLIQTRALLYNTVEKRVLELHSYKTPAIFSIPMANINHQYGLWLRNETAEEI